MNNNEDIQRIVIRNESELQELLNNDNMKRIVKELIIKENCGNEMKYDLEFRDFEELECLIVEKDALQNVESLTIADNPKLRVFRTVTGDGGWKQGDPRNSGAFYNTKDIAIDSLLLMIC